MLIIDSNGQSEIVGAFLTTSETEEAIRKMVQAFKVENPSWSPSEVGMTEFEERLLLMKQVRDSWAHGGKVTVQAIAPGKRSIIILLCVDVICCSKQ